MIKKRSHVLGSTAGMTYSFLAMAMIVCVLGFIIIVLLKDGASVLSWHFISTEPDPSALSAANGGYSRRSSARRSAGHRYRHLLSVRARNGNISVFSLKKVCSERLSKVRWIFLPVSDHRFRTFCAGIFTLPQFGF
jgi:hypothetical protein